MLFRPAAGHYRRHFAKMVINAAQVQIGPGTLTASYIMYTGSLARGKAAKAQC